MYIVVVGLVEVVKLPESGEFDSQPWGRNDRKENFRINIARPSLNIQIKVLAHFSHAIPDLFQN